MINPKQCKCNPMINRQMEANKKKSNDFLIIKNKTEHVLEESKHAKTKISKQQKADKHTHAQQRVKTRTFNYRKLEIMNLKPQLNTHISIHIYFTINHRFELSHTHNLNFNSCFVKCVCVCVWRRMKCSCCVSRASFS